MKKAYCNKCEVEITKENKFNNFEVKVEDVSFGVEIEDEIPTEYDICKYCVLDAIAAHDDRPRSD